MNKLKKIVFVFPLILPYLITLLSFTNIHLLSNRASDILWYVNLFFSTPGLIILGFIFLVDNRNKGIQIVCTVCILLGVLYLVLFYWAVSTGL